MKFLRTQKGGHGVAAFAFQMSREELDWLLATLRLYPMLPGDYHQITISNAEELKAGQSLLEEAMAQQRADHKQKLDRFLASPGRFRVEGPDLYRFNVTGDQLEWLLQILNDVRVGCWVKLGKPELEAARRRNTPPSRPARCWRWSTAAFSRWPFSRPSRFRRTPCPVEAALLRVLHDTIALRDVLAAGDSRSAGDDSAVVLFIPTDGIEDEPVIVGAAVFHRLAVDDVVRQFVGKARNQFVELFGIAPFG